MSIRLEFINFIIPVSLIRDKYPGGWDACLHDHRYLIGGRVWYDSHLFRDGAMNPGDIGKLVEEWIELGFEPYMIVDGNKSWKECCVVETMFGGATLPCEWIHVDVVQDIAYLEGTEPGEVIGRDEFQYNSEEPPTITE